MAAVRLHALGDSLEVHGHRIPQPRWKCRRVFVSSLLTYHTVGLEQIADQVWPVYFGPLHLGWLDEADYRIIDVKKRSQRTR